jgi:protein involved in polysaccharide export with SLBB domain
MDADHRLTRRLVLLVGLLAGGCASAAPPLATGGEGFADIPYADWSDAEPPYRLYPGDEVEVTLATAPELNRTVRIQPDGRISLPLIEPVMVTDRTVDEVQRTLAQAYAAQLKRPDVAVAPRAAPLRVFVGGEVTTSGVYEMVGDSDALRAIVQAGGFRPSADLKRVVILRRGPGGRGMIRQVNLSRGLKAPGADLVPLRRFDVVFVPRSGVAKAGLAVQQYFRDLSPIQVGFSYALGDTNNNN